MYAEILERQVVGTIIKEVHDEVLRLADSAQSELHGIVRERIAASGGIEDMGIVPEPISLRAQTLAAALRDRVAAFPRYKGRTVIRRSLLRRTIDSLEPTWLIGGVRKPLSLTPRDERQRNFLQTAERGRRFRDQTMEEWEPTAANGMLGTALLLVASDSNAKIEKRFLQNLTYSQSLNSVQSSKENIVAFKWIPLSIAPYESLINQSCGAPCVDTCVEPGCACFEGRCR